MMGGKFKGLKGEIKQVGEEFGQEQLSEESDLLL